MNEDDVQHQRIANMPIGGSSQITTDERDQVSTVLYLRANEVEAYLEKYRDGVPESVEYALELEIKRLRRLADKLSS